MLYLSRGVLMVSYVKALLCDVIPWRVLYHYAKASFQSLLPTNNSYFCFPLHMSDFIQKLFFVCETFFWGGDFFFFFFCEIFFGKTFYFGKTFLFGETSLGETSFGVYRFYTGYTKWHWFIQTAGQTHKLNYMID